MSVADKPAIALYCHCAYTNLVTDEVRAAVFAAMAESGVRLEAVPDLCSLAAQRDPRLATWFAQRPLVVAACYPRTIRWLLSYAGIGSPTEKIMVFNMRTESPDMVRWILPASMDTPAAMPAMPCEQWVPWFPVIDYDRCNHCRQCLSFCPFGVYEIEQKRVVVKNPAQCKNNCPACARICPQVAIVFPKVKDAPINGAEVTPEDLARQTKSAVNDETDLHALLARRRMKAAAGRFARNLEDSGATSQSEKVT